MVNPVGAYYKSGLQAVDAMVVENHDRAAPKGIGHVKAGGNYAADLLPSKAIAEQGFPIALYLDAKENRYIEEFSTSNFIGISKEGNYVKPTSSTILPSTTNMVSAVSRMCWVIDGSRMQVLSTLAQDAGITVEERPVEFTEVIRIDDGVCAIHLFSQVASMSEVGACGTAVVLTPVKSITKVQTEQAG